MPALLCGVDVGSKILQGLVTNVHDGDTLTLSVSGTAYQIRLDSIDAPELAQPFGDLSQRTLAGSLLGKQVKVAYSKTDQYDRIVGAVFTDSCQYVNLSQVVAGLAWFYKAYQCEVTAATRIQFNEAQNIAVAEKKGLWMQSDPEAPWFYRNGVEPVTPTCASDLATTSASPALSFVGPTTVASSASPIAVSGTQPASSKICYTGPRGGTYTLTANRKKDYSGC